jgi:hypothetical protein
MRADAGAISQRLRVLKQRAAFFGENVIEVLFERGTGTRKRHVSRRGAESVEKMKVAAE